MQNEQANKQLEPEVQPLRDLYSDVEVNTTRISTNVHRQSLLPKNWAAYIGLVTKCVCVVHVLASTLGNIERSLSKHLIILGASFPDFPTREVDDDNGPLGHPVIQYKMSG